MYHIAVVQTCAAVDGTSSLMSMTLDGVSRDDATLPLVDDRQEHWVEVSVQAQPAGAPSPDVRDQDGDVSLPVQVSLAPVA